MNERNFIILIILIAILIFSPLAFSLMGFGMMWPGMMGGQFYGGFWRIPFTMILFWVFISLGIYFVVRAFIPSTRIQHEGESNRAMAIARERLARGEITIEEFERLKKSLSE